MKNKKYNIYLTLIFLPLMSSLVSGFFGRKIGVKGAHILSCSSIVITTILAIIVFFEGINSIPVEIKLFRWIDLESINIYWNFNFDSLTISMLIPVLIVSSLVHIYSIGYMSTDPHNQRFFSYLSLFTFMMIILVTGNNFLVMFVGWEGVGVCSYLLVSFWFTRIAANQSSLSAFLTNRVGDCFLTIGIFIILLTFGNIDYYTVFTLSPYINANIIFVIGLCLLIGAMAKSSQLGLHVWLPFAMEGPTPVSALIHAATMVTAGVYLLIRTSPLIEYSDTILLICLWLGSVTTMTSSLIGFFQEDIKKIIAYSTMSQLGMMVLAIGLSSYNISLFHLINHAFYKALLFLGAGSVIHGMHDNQDLRKYGGLKIFLPLSYTIMLIASLSLMALPFMSGFYSKDFILESAYGQFYFSSKVIYFLALLGATFTALYSIKVLYLTFISAPNGYLTDYKKAHEGDIYMSLPLIILSVFSILFGFVTKDMFIGMGSGFFLDNAIFIHPNHEIMLQTEFALPSSIKILPLIMTIFSFVYYNGYVNRSIIYLIIGYIILSMISLTNVNNIDTVVYLIVIITSIFVYKIINILNLNIYINKVITFIYLYIGIKLNFNPLIHFNKISINITNFFNQRLYFELFYNKFISEKVLNLGSQTTKVLDKGSIEYLGPYGLEIGLNNLGKEISKLDSGKINSYALYILTGFVVYIFILNSLFMDELILIIYIGMIFMNIKSKSHN
jgi:NADH-ubiquinone oxidoreductase chain 5